MKIKILYREITSCEMCPYCHEYVCQHPDEKIDVSTASKSIPSHCLLPDMRLDTEDDSTE
jgi:hypothetical protein